MNGRWNDARWKFQTIMGMAANADLALQRDEPNRAREELSRITKRLQELREQLEEQP